MRLRYANSISIFLRSRRDTEAVPDQEHPDHQLWIDRRPTNATVEWRQVPPDVICITEARTT
ncbi:hypothetical protein ACVWXL_000498 [Bradyrhizobium sp. GM22.5]